MSGMIGDNQSSDMSVTLDVTADGIIEFYYKVSAEYSTSGNYFYDGLEFYIDNALKGQYQTNTSGESPWTYVSYEVEEGEHTFRWSYVKDGAGGSTDCSNTGCADAAWIDDIVFPPAYMESDGTLGDVNMDDIINILDVIVIINMILGTETENILADLNVDGNINIQDIILVINMILGDNLSRNKHVENVEIKMSSNKIVFSTNEPIGGIELHTSGDYSINKMIIPDGWEYFENNNTIIMVDIERNIINTPIEIHFSGVLEIQKNIISDWCGHGFTAEVKHIPNKMGLNSAYPNPFNPVTSINYNLSKSGHVELGIYNLAGQLVETIINEKKDAGNYTLIWDASLQTSGMYFLRMRTVEGIHHQKLMLVK